MQTFIVRGDHITLGQFLKLSGVVQTGGEAKQYLAGQVVKVNGEPESRRGRKLRPGDRVETPGSGSWRMDGEPPVPDSPDALI